MKSRYFYELPEITSNYLNYPKDNIFRHFFKELMIPNQEGLHCLAIKKLSPLLREIRSKHVGDFYCLNCLHLFRTKNKLENKDFCDVVIASEDTKISEFNQYQKSAKTPSIIHADLESLIKKWMDVKIILNNHLQQ